MFRNKSKSIINNLFMSPKIELYKKENFLWLLRQEIFRAERSNQPLSMILLEISNLKDMMQIYFDIPLNKLINEILYVFEKDFRKTDIKGWYDKSILALLMPNTSKSGAQIAYKKLKKNVSSFLEQKEGEYNNHFDKACSIHTFPDSLIENNLLDKGFESKGRIQNPYTLYQNLFKYHSKSRFQHFLKRIIDLFGSIIGLLCFMPFLAIIGLIIKLSSPGPIFFKQIRFGYHGIPFTFYKFRSMYQNVDDRCHREYVHKLIQGNINETNLGSAQKPVLKLNNDSRITTFGNILRKSSLDELPQLFNVLKGEMSFVGPRPPIPYEIEKYQNWHLRRILEVKPGITGIWQVNGRSRSSFDDMVRMDLQYAKNWSIGMDIKILFKTIKVVFCAAGAY